MKKQAQITFWCSPAFKEFAEQRLKAGLINKAQACQVALWHFLHQPEAERQKIAAGFAEAEAKGFRGTDSDRRRQS